MLSPTSRPIREAAEGRSDPSPSTVLSLLPRRVAILIVGWLTALSAAAWVITARSTSAMGHMELRLEHVAMEMETTLTLPIFLGMWLGMMVAMMFPTIAPMVAAHGLVLRRRGEGPHANIVFVGGYLAVWSVIGLVPFGLLTAFRSFASRMSDPEIVGVAAGGVLLLCGIYQFTAWKNICLTHCRNPLAFVLSHNFGAGWRGAFRAGVSHGAYCLGCCWALMAVLLIVGLMNLVWMAAIALVFLAEKNWRHGVAVARAVGAGLVALGLVLIARPELLDVASGGAVM